MKKCMFICVCLLSIQVTITMDNGRNNKKTEKQKPTGSIENLFKKQHKGPTCKKPTELKKFKGRKARLVGGTRKKPPRRKTR